MYKATAKLGEFLEAKFPTRSEGAVLGLRRRTSNKFTPVLAKHSKSFSLIDCLLVGVDRMQRNLSRCEKWKPRAK